MGSERVDSTDRREMGAIIEAQRQQLFKASAVIDMCRYACASQFDGFDPEQLAVALHVVFDLVNDATSVLEQFTGNEVTDSD